MPYTIGWVNAWLCLFVGALPVLQSPLDAQLRSPAAATGYISTLAAPDRFPLIVRQLPAAVWVSSEDYAGVRRAINSLQADLARVSGNEPKLLVDSLPAGRVIIAGTLGKSPLIDRLAREGKLDVTRVRGRWETFVLQTVDRPAPGIERALVIAGSDKRGTIFGIYDLSAEIGVSPWHWWADVPVRRQAQLYVLPGRHSRGEPAVKYRGFFINDEAPALSGWTREKFGGFNHEFYEKVFELLLRLKGNYLWPAMWGNAFNDDDKLNPQLADEYGVVMGTSHHEPMLRAQQEWRRYGTGAWNYETNADVLKQFWRDGIRNMGTHESIVTIGMRGDGDMPMTEQSNIALLERIVRDQREIIGEVTGKEPAETPQLWALYKEVQDYYDRGMRAPDDVTLLFADDNWGNIRRLAKPGDPARAGGYGVYYHFDYVGGPRNYKWLNTNQIERVWEQMGKAYALGANRIWIVNVGDIKPVEFPLQFFLDYAWNPSEWSVERMTDYTRAWAAQQFGPQYAPQIASLIATYTRYNARRKPELIAPGTYSLTNYGEAERVVAEYNALAAEAARVQTLLPAAYRDAFYQLVLHPIIACANLNDLYVVAAQNTVAAKQGRATTNRLADGVAELFARDAQISAFYNDTLAGGKWHHMMDQTHIGYTYWQEPPRNALPAVTRVELPEAAELGVAIAGADKWWPREAAPAILPELDVYARQTYAIDVFNRGRTSFPVSVRPGATWLRVTPASGLVREHLRLQVSVDWQRAPVGRDTVAITIEGAGARIIVHAPVHKPAAPARADVRGFVESNGVVSMEAEHYTRAVSAGALKWVTIPNLGRTLSGVIATPVTAGVQSPSADSPRLEYQMHLFRGDSVTVHAYASPTLDYNDLKGLRYGVSIDDETPQIINSLPDTTLRAWERGVADNIRITTSPHKLSGPGNHVLKFWLVDPGLVLQKLVVDAGGLSPSYLGPPESYYRRPTQRAQVKARFDWFSYQGDDPVYRGIKADSNAYLNPILPGFYPDPSICRSGSDYYMVTSTFAYYPGIPVFHSRDLVNWTQIGNVLERPSQMSIDTLGISRGVFAPSISCHNGTFYVINTLADAGGNFLVTATNAAGPWSDPVWLNFDGIDPSLFFDDDGRVWIVNNGPPASEPLYEGHRALWIQEYDAKTKRMIGPRTMIVNGGVDLAKKPIWIEAPHIFRKDGTYYLIAAEGGTAEEHSEVVFRSKSVLGPWEPYSDNPILTQRHLHPGRPFPITSTGHADFVETQNGEWWAVFLGARPYKDNFYNTGRETFMLPVHWLNGWPRILDGKATVPYSAPRPNLPLQPSGRALKTGNFTERADFNETKLPLHWTFMRTIREPWFDLTSKPGWLTIDARPVDIGKRTQPSFIGRRQQHAFATVSTALQITPGADDEKAGLAAFQGDDNYYLLVVTQARGKRFIQLEQSGVTPGKTRVIASAPLTSAPGSTVFLKIVARGDRYDFLYGLSPEKWVVLKNDVDGTFLSTKAAGGFVGSMFGMYAYSQN